MKTTKDWERDFIPREYLKEYYQNIGRENQALLRFLTNACKCIPKNSTILEFGGGPCVYQMIVFALKAKCIHYSEFVSDNRREVVSWLKNTEDAFDWTQFTAEILKLEDSQEVSDKEIINRENLTRRKVKQVIAVDAFKDKPLGFDKKYDVLSMNFVAESITDNYDEWEKIMDRVLGLLSPKGNLIISAIRDAKSYKVGKKYFPAVSINEKMMENFFRTRGFEKIIISSVDAEQPDLHNYSGLIFVFASM